MCIRQERVWAWAVLVGSGHCTITERARERESVSQVVHYTALHFRRETHTLTHSRLVHCDAV